jgi:anti-anti-sigma factor
MEINITTGKQTLITINGRLDTVSAPQFEEAIAPILTGEMKEVVVDCAAMDYISSSGLRIFLALLKSAMAKKGNLLLKGMKPEIREVFDMTGFSAIFTIE